MDTFSQRNSSSHNNIVTLSLIFYLHPFKMWILIECGIQSMWLSKTIYTFLPGIASIKHNLNVLGDGTPMSTNVKCHKRFHKAEWTRVTLRERNWSRCGMAARQFEPVFSRLTGEHNPVTSDQRASASWYAQMFIIIHKYIHYYKI